MTDDRKGDRHKNPPRAWRPDESTFAEAKAAASEAAGSLNAYLRLSIDYLLGLRKDPPPRPDWAEQRAAQADESGGIRPDEDTET